MNTKWLDTINSPQDLKKIPVKELKILAQEIRDFLIEKVTITGGHLAPNLGVVELTIALHYVFDSPKDGFLWDVGHQAYVHKILTGRKDLFLTLRQKDGLSGFPCPQESIHDLTSVGHSSTSVSTAVGVATAKKMNNDNSSTIAIIGDGSFTSGMVYEALNDASWRKLPILVVLNDNTMSISKNVGGIATHLDALRSNKFYLKLKQKTYRLLQKTRFGRFLAKELYFLKSFFKNTMFQRQNMFENLGVRYLGPYSGHDVEQLISLFTQIRTLPHDQPNVVHILTQKGLGHDESVNNPISFHGISGNTSCNMQGMSWSAIFGNAVCTLASQNQNIVLITAAMREGTGLVEFSKCFTDRLIDVGIAEQHAVTCASGLALSGKKPIVAIYSTFMQRSYDQLIHDVALESKPVIFCLDRAGFVPNDGKTHQGVFDISYLRSIPNMIIMSPLVESEMFHMLEFALKQDKPVAIRYPKDNAPQFEIAHQDIILGQGIEIISGNDGVFVVFGSLFDEVCSAQKILTEHGKDYAIYHIRFAKPINEEVITYLSAYKTVVIVEEGIQNGGFGEEIARRLQPHSTDVILKNIGDCVPNTDSRKGLIDEFGFNADSLIKDLV